MRDLTVSFKALISSGLMNCTKGVNLRMLNKVRK